MTEAPHLLLQHLLWQSALLPNSIVLTEEEEEMIKMKEEEEEKGKNEQKEQKEQKEQQEQKKEEQDQEQALSHSHSRVLCHRGCVIESFLFEYEAILR